MSGESKHHEASTIQPGAMIQLREGTVVTGITVQQLTEYILARLEAAKSEDTE